MEPAKRRILVLDDETLMAHTLHRMLRRSYAVSIETDGSRALAVLEREAFDLVICDLMMSPLTGKEIYERAAAKVPLLTDRFLLMTGGAYQPEVERFLTGWPYFVLLKPFDSADVERLVTASLARARTQSAAGAP